MALIRGGIIGYGFIASQGHAPAYSERDDVEIVAIADICPPRLANAQRDFGHARLYGSAEELITREAGRLDFVDIATPPVYHASIASLAIEHNLHVLCEKPLTTSTNDARRLIDLAKRNRRVLFPCHNYKHAPVVKAIREILDGGQIGKVTAVSLSTFRNIHARGVQEWHSHWRREAEYSGGGIAMDHGSHTFYLCFDWLGSYPTAISAKMTSREPDKYNTEDNFTATVTFPTGTANINLSWTAGIRKVVYIIQGERGAVMVDDDDLQIALQDTEYYPAAAQNSVSWSLQRRSIASMWTDASHFQWFNSLFSDFRRAIASDDYTGRDVHDALKCIQVIDAAYQSARALCREAAIDELT
jgi:predicted dehydrogenase